MRQKFKITNLLFAFVQHREREREIEIGTKKIDPIEQQI